MTDHVLTWGRTLMADLKNGLQDSRMLDAQKLWLPVGKVIAIAVGFIALIFALGMWTQKTNDRTESAAGLEIQLQSVNNQLATLQGSVNVLTTMQETVAQTKADVGALTSRIDALERESRTENRLLRDYMEGRIGHLQYRPPNTNAGPQGERR